MLKKYEFEYGEINCCDDCPLLKLVEDNYNMIDWLSCEFIGQLEDDFDTSKHKHPKCILKETS